MAQKVWTFKPTVSDEELIEAEIERLRDRNPGVAFTRADAMRSMFVRASAASTNMVLC